MSDQSAYIPLDIHPDGGGHSELDIEIDDDSFFGDDFKDKKVKLFIRINYKEYFQTENPNSEPKPIEEPEKKETQKEEIKKDESKKEEPQKEEIQKKETKKEESKEEEPQKEESQKEETKKEESKEEPKETKNEELKPIEKCSSTSKQNFTVGFSPGSKSSIQYKKPTSYKKVYATKK